MPNDTSRPRRIDMPAFLLGVGFGGLIDGVVLHQILQWHHLLTDTGDHPATTVAGLEVNTLADGLFHLVSLVILGVAISLLWSRTRDGARASGRRVLGVAIVGWGVFDLVEGLVDHQLLGIHHVREGPDAFAWDMAFLAFGAVLVLVGWALARSDARQAEGLTAAPDAPAGSTSRAA
jgi:uncharacterized membrane protein